MIDAPVSEMDLFAEKVAVALLDRMKPAIPLSVDLWDLKMVAAYLKRNPRSVAERIVVVPSFPQAIRIPSKEAGKPRPLWRAADVIRWAESHMDTTGSK